MSKEFNPYGYQRYAIEKMVSEEKVGAFLDMGLGKTVSTLMAIKELKYDRLSVRKTLVIAPKKVAEATWAQEKDKWSQTEDLTMEIVLGSEKKRLDALDREADIYVINRENVTWLVEHYMEKGFQWPFDMVVIDESTSFKNHRSKRFKSICKVLPKVNRLILLTGTPSPNGMEDLWAQIYLLDQGERLGRRFTGFRDRFFNVGAHNGYVVYSYTLKAGAEEYIMDKISDLCITMKSEDYLDLPDMMEDVVPVKLSDKAKKKYDEMEKTYVMGLMEEEEVTATSAAAVTNKLLQISNGAVYDEERMVHEVHDDKLDAFEELLEQIHQPALVFYNFQHDRTRLEERLSGMKLRYKTLDGQGTEDAIKRWNDGELDVLLAHPASAGYGLNLQEGGRHVIWFGLTWNYEQYSQANKRLHRQGQKDVVIVHHLVSIGTKDEDVMKALEKKEKAQDYVLESLKAKVEEVRQHGI